MYWGDIIPLKNVGNYKKIKFIRQNKCINLLTTYCINRILTSSYNRSKTINNIFFSFDSYILYQIMKIKLGYTLLNLYY